MLPQFFFPLITLHFTFRGFFFPDFVFCFSNSAKEKSSTTLSLWVQATIENLKNEHSNEKAKDTESLLEWKALATLVSCAIIDVELAEKLALGSLTEIPKPPNISNLLKHLGEHEFCSLILTYQDPNFKRIKKQKGQPNLSDLFQNILNGINEEKKIEIDPTDYYQATLYCIRKIYNDTKYTPANFKQSELLLSQRWAHYTSLRWASEAKIFSDLKVRIYTTGGQKVPPFSKTDTNVGVNQSNNNQTLKKQKTEEKNNKKRKKKNNKKRKKKNNKKRKKKNNKKRKKKTTRKGKKRKKNLPRFNVLL